MNISPWILGAAALVPIAGAVAGKAMITDPIGIHADVTASLPQGSSGYNNAGQSLEQANLPDHYALETPEGRFEVGELIWNGRYRNRARYNYGDSYTDDYDFDAEIARLEARWDLDDSTSRAAAALDAQQPEMPRFHRTAEAPHYATMASARTGEGAPQISNSETQGATPVSTQASQPQPHVANLQIDTAPAARAVNVRVELAMRD